MILKIYDKLINMDNVKSINLVWDCITFDFIGERDRIYFATEKEAKEIYDKIVKYFGFEDEIIDIMEWEEPK